MKHFSAGAAVVAAVAMIAAACTPEENNQATAANASVSAGTASGGMGGGGATGGQGGAGAAGGASGGGGAGGAGVHGCQAATAVDRTGQATVLINDIDAWDFDHKVCVRVDGGTTVRWEGNFGLHPLDGGVSPTNDATSPISMGTVQNDGTDFIAVRLATEGDYPYFCGAHFASMSGVIFVEGNGGAGGAGGTGGAGGAGGSN